MDELLAGKHVVPVTEGKRPLGPASRVRYQVLMFVCVLAVITYIQRLGFSSGTPFIEKSLDLDDEHMGYFAAAFLVAYGLFQVPGGLLGDRFGARHLLTILVLGWSVLTGSVALAVVLPGGLAVQFGFLLVVRFLFGAFQAGGFPVIGRIVADWMRVTERGFAQGAIWMLSRLGGTLIPFLLVWLFRWSGDWPIPFVIIGGLGVLWCGAFWPWFRNRPEEIARVNWAERELIAAGRPPPTSQPRSVPWARMARSRSVWALCLMYGCAGFAGNFFTTMLPLYLSKHRLLDHDITAWLSALPLAGGAIGCILGGATSDWLIRRWGNRRWGRRIVGAVGLTLTGIALLSTLWAEEIWLLGLLLTVTFFCNDLSMGPAWAACADIGERYAGTLSGAMNMTGALLGAVGAVLAGYLFRRGLSEYVFVIFAEAYVLAAVCWLGVDATKRLTDTPER
jgi:MFS transporter, ACS family, glucarate transporter